MIAICEQRSKTQMVVRNNDTKAIKGKEAPMGKLTPNWPRKGEVRITTKMDLFVLAV